jgi:hypothetical protein
MIVNIAGHRVTALIRSEASAIRLPTGDVRIVAGSVENLGAVERGLESADAAIYLAMQGIQGASDADRAALHAITDHFSGTHRSPIVPSGLGVYVGTPEPVVDETTPLDHVPPGQAWRVALERDLLATGARAHAHVSKRYVRESRHTATGCRALSEGHLRSSRRRCSARRQPLKSVITRWRETPLLAASTCAALTG